MYELKVAIYYRAASLPSQASYAVLAEESQAFFKHSPHTYSAPEYILLFGTKRWAGARFEVTRDDSNCSLKNYGFLYDAIFLHVYACAQITEP